MQNLVAILEMNRDESNNMEDTMEEGILEDGDSMGPDAMSNGESPPPEMIQEEEMTTTNLEMAKEEMTVEMEKNLDVGDRLGPDAMLDGESPHPEMNQEVEMTTTSQEMTTTTRRGDRVQWRWIQIQRCLDITWT